MDKSCDNCRHSKKVLWTPPVGLNPKSRTVIECHRFPPLILDEMKEGIFPLVAANDICGEFSLSGN